MYYLVYKITNIINGKFYIGAHRTVNKNDGYMGSGELIKKAIKKYGTENFKKEVLLECSSIKEMFDREREMVVIDNNTTYNISPGGVSPFDGGLDHISFSKKGNKILQDLMKNKKYAAQVRKRWYEAIAKSLRYKECLERRKTNPTFKGKRHTEETKKRIGMANSTAQRGRGNSQHGTMWITNEKEKRNKKVLVNSLIPNGWVKGRKMYNTQYHGDNNV